jgi:hypothetical protein
MRGLIGYRAAISGLGFTGFQWIAGSFTEDIETHGQRHPNDVDVVNFVHRPLGLAQPAAWQQFVTANSAALNALFNPNLAKATFGCDAFPIDLDLPQTTIVERTRYWFGLFTHQRRTYSWKGIIQIPLRDNDAAATSWIDTRFGP